MFSGIPLPKVVADNEPGGGIITAYNALSKAKQGNAESNAKSKYADYQAYANALLTQKQAQAQNITAVSNPLLWATPQGAAAAQKILESINQGGNGGGGNVPNPPDPNSVPSPNGGGGGGNSLVDSNSIMGQIMNKIQQLGGGGSGSASNSLNAQPNPTGSPTPAPTQGGTNQNALVPGAQGTMAGAVGSQTIPFKESPNTPGKSFATANGGVSSAPDANTTNSAQQGILGIKNLKPLTDRIAKGAEKWRSPGTPGALRIAGILNTLKQQFGSLNGIPDTLLEQTGITSKDLSDYAKWQSDIDSAKETLLKARNWPNDAVALQMIEKIVEPRPNEGKEYGQRVAEQFADMERDILPNYKDVLANGLPLNNGNAAPNANEQEKERKASENEKTTAATAEPKKPKKPFAANTVRYESPEGEQYDFPIANEKKIPSSWHKVAA